MDKEREMSDYKDYRYAQIEDAERIAEKIDAYFPSDVLEQMEIKADSFLLHSVELLIDRVIELEEKVNSIEYPLG